MHKDVSSWSNFLEILKEDEYRFKRTDVKKDGYMKIFIVALNADTRGVNERYQEFPKSYKEYEKILGKKPSGNGFHECVNFRECHDRVYGFFQAWRNISIRNPDEEFMLISVTYKKKKFFSNKIIGIQAGCRYQAVDNICGIPRDDVPPTLYNEIKKKLSPLTYHYTCPSKYSLLFSEQIDDAVRVVFGKDEWKRPSIKEVDEKRLPAIMKAIDKHFSNTKGEDYNAELIKWNNIKNYLEMPDLQEICNPDGIFYDEENERNKQFLELLEKVKSPKTNPYVEYKGKRFARSSLVKRMALLRSGAKCEYCKKAPPFFDKYGEPFFEVHHIIALSKGGADDIDNVAALCPNCHRKIHLATALSRHSMRGQLENRIPKANLKMINVKIKF